MKTNRKYLNKRSGEESLKEGMSRLEIIKYNKALYSRLEKSLNNLPDDLKKYVIKYYGLPWCKSNNWLGGMSDSASNKAIYKILSLGDYTTDEILDEIDNFIDCFISDNSNKSEDEKLKLYLNESLNEGLSSYTSDFKDFVERVDEVSTEDGLRKLYNEVNEYGFNMSDLHYLTYLIFKKMKSLEESLNEDLFDKPRNIADSICKYLDSKNFYNYELVDYDAYPMNTSKITFEVDGDWKHDHWRFKDLVYDWSFDNNKSIYKMESELVRDDGSDSYASNYFIYVTENEDSLNTLKSMSKLFSEEYEEESLSEDLGLDPWYGKYVPIDIGGSRGTPRKVYFYFDSMDFDEAEEEFFDIIPEPYVKAKLYGRASESSLVKDGWKNINESLKESLRSLNESSKKDFKDKYLNLKRKIEDEASKNNSMVFFSDGEDILPAFRVKSRDKFYSTCMWNALCNMIGTEEGLRRYSDTEFGYEERLSKFRSLLSGNTYKKRSYSGNMVKSNSSTGIVGITRLSDGSVRPNIKFKGIKFTGKRTFDEEKAKSIRKSMEEIVNHGGLSDEEKIDKLREVIKESLNESNNVIDFLKGIKFGDEFDFEEVGDWGISAWTSRPLLNFSNGFYIVQLDNDKLNKHFVIPDNETEDEFIRNRDSFIKRHFNDLNESVKGMRRANRKTGSLNEASYGGAFDIEDDQFFTRDDINEFAWEVADSLSSEFGKTFDVADSYMETPKRLHLEVTDGDYDYFADIDINMRRIRSPRDLMKYLNDAIDQIKSQMGEY